ncbi:type II 3-dehydroquinate dehydratase [Desulfosarcina sp.]|uniref:type II 3-dehydroquinate dehydratase n=1 Tax=Desulfosarcina sp. TaxID=2027861 RepID=UPI0029BCEEEB|nr:type II 3-dehydroquinate dehydratase [Desulfosarcina sp.]MDX2451168.1 type II 3-dehydroquinate dehydratase [Desulfosarcina sp.]MDX2489007.1 type II 3-dehydroquinate dehydratase [Desulfosarcina sp.]
MADSRQNQLILVVHGPNLNMLGKREPEHYGSRTLEEIDASLHAKATELGLEISTFQSNHEGEIVESIQKGVGRVQGLIINPAAFTHTSVAIRDAVLILDVPTIEVHLSNIHQRESFRQRSFIADIATAQISGLGASGYLYALEALAQLID